MSEIQVDGLAVASALPVPAGGPGISKIGLGDINPAGVRTGVSELLRYCSIG